MSNENEALNDALAELTAGVMPHIAERIKRAYWAGISDALSLDRRDALRPLKSVLSSDQHVPIPIRRHAE